jgi:hypothetical protein
MKNLAGGARDERSNSSNRSISIPCPYSRYSICILVPDSDGQGIGPGPGAGAPIGKFKQAIWSRYGLNHAVLTSMNKAFCVQLKTEKCPIVDR